MDWCIRYYLFYLWFLLYAVFRNEESVVFIAIIIFFSLSCCLAFFLIFNQSICFLWKLFLLKRFSAVIDMVVLQSIKSFSLKTFLLKRFFSHNWYGCLAFLNFNQSSCFLWKLFFLRDFFTWLSLNIKNI